jgi:hypothetical protein
VAYKGDVDSWLLGLPPLLLLLLLLSLLLLLLLGALLAQAAAVLSAASAKGFRLWPGCSTSASLLPITAAPWLSMSFVTAAAAAAAAAVGPTLCLLLGTDVSSADKAY